MIRPDYIFSYWIFGWYILYITGLFNHNPKFALYLGLLENLFVLVSMIYYNVNVKNIFYFTLIILLMKVIPLWTLRQTTMSEKDLYATLGIFLMYIGWIVWEEHVFILYKAYTDMLNNKNQLPGMLFLEKILR
jgi:hypothetical protein